MSNWHHMNESLNRSFTRTILSTMLILLVMQTNDRPYERVTESLLIQSICSVILIHSVTKQATGYMNESLNRPFKWVILKHWFTESLNCWMLLLLQRFCEIKEICTWRSEAISLLIYILAVQCFIRVISHLQGHWLLYMITIEYSNNPLKAIGVRLYIYI